MSQWVGNGIRNHLNQLCADIVNPGAEYFSDPGMLHTSVGVMGLKLNPAVAGGFKRWRGLSLTTGILDANAGPISEKIY